jgi:hypothetical protein
MPAKGSNGRRSAQKSDPEAVYLRPADRLKLDLNTKD